MSKMLSTESVAHPGRNCCFPSLHLPHPLSLSFFLYWPQTHLLLDGGQGVALSPSQPTHCSPTLCCPWSSVCLSDLQGVFCFTNGLAGGKEKHFWSKPVISFTVLEGEVTHQHSEGVKLYEHPTILTFRQM
jgi:hypothetical protein